MLTFDRGLFSKADCEQITQDLTYELPNYMDPKKPFKELFYSISTQTVTLPKFYAKKKFNLLLPDIVSLAKMQTGLTLNGILQATEQRPQEKVFSATIEALMSQSGTMIILPCGTGKTNIAIAIALHMGYKTAILCHQNFLLDQWSERIQEFVCGGIRIGKMQQNECDTKDKDIVLCSIKSLLSRDYPVTDTSFGLVIVDEAHHIAAPTFSQVLSKLKYQYSLGLTATPKRKDKLEDIIYYLLGSPCFSLCRQGRPDVQVNRVFYTQGLEKVVTYKNKVIGISRMVSNLTVDSKRNQIIIKILQAMRTLDPPRKGLLLSDRVDHLKELYKLIGSDQADIVCGKIKTNKNALAFDKFITLSTFHMFSEAVDFTGDFVILSTPRSEVEQCTGRILRGHSQVRPVIIDIVDNFSVFGCMARKREKYYTETCKYEVLTIQDSQL